MTIRRILSRIEVTLAQAFGEKLEGPCIGAVNKVLIVAFCFTGQQYMHTVMKVVTPLGIQPKSMVLARTHHAGIIEVTFGNEVDTTIEVNGFTIDDSR